MATLNKAETEVLRKVVRALKGQATTKRWMRPEECKELADQLNTVLQMKGHYNA